MTTMGGDLRATDNKLTKHANDMAGQPCEEEAGWGEERVEKLALRWHWVCDTDDDGAVTSTYVICQQTVHTHSLVFILPLGG